MFVQILYKRLRSESGESPVGAQAAALFELLVRNADRAVAGAVCCANRLRRERRPRGFSDAFVRRVRDSPIAEHVAQAHEQHYDVPAGPSRIVLGPRLKQCLRVAAGTETLAQAGAAMLLLTCERAAVDDGMTLLDLGCGWG